MRSTRESHYHHYHSRNRSSQFPVSSQCSLTAGQKASQTDRVSPCKQRGGAPRQLKPTACKLNPVAYSQIYSVQWSFATLHQPAEPQPDPEAQQHLALPLLITGKHPANKSVCVAIPFHVRREPCSYITVLLDLKNNAFVSCL